MAALISKRLLRSSGSLHSLGRHCFGSPYAGFASFYKSHGKTLFVALTENRDAFALNSIFIYFIFFGFL